MPSLACTSRVVSSSFASLQGLGDDDEEDEDDDDDAADYDDDDNHDATLHKYMHGRGNRERRDSISPEMLSDRMTHQERLSTIRVTSEQLRKIQRLGLGQKQRINNVYLKTANYFTADSRKTTTAAGGFSHHLTSASAADPITRQWPIFPHLLPEFAFAGHSNSGKSTLVNAMCGVKPKKGPAGISDRAGWTDQICFYRLGKVLEYRIYFRSNYE